MPVTPFHFGPGILLKSIFRRNFNLTTFVLVQICIDFEVIWNLFFNNDERLHTFFHTYLGSSTTILIIFIGMYFIYHILKKNFPIKVILISAAIGAWSHVFLDSIMHADLIPFYPFSLNNSMLFQISLLSLHLGCILSAILGGMIYFLSK